MGKQQIVACMHINIRSRGKTKTKLEDSSNKIQVHGGRRARSPSQFTICFIFNILIIFFFFKQTIFFFLFKLYFLLLYVTIKNENWEWRKSETKTLILYISIWRWEKWRRVGQIVDKENRRKNRKSGESLNKWWWLSQREDTRRIETLQNYRWERCRYTHKHTYWKTDHKQEIKWIFIK